MEDFQRVKTAKDPPGTGLEAASATGLHAELRASASILRFADRDHGKGGDQARHQGAAIARCAISTGVRETRIVFSVP